MTIVSERRQVKVHNIWTVEKIFLTEKNQTYLKKEIQHFLQQFVVGYVIHSRVILVLWLWNTGGGHCYKFSNKINGALNRGRPLLNDHRVHHEQLEILPKVVYVTLKSQKHIRQLDTKTNSLHLNSSMQFTSFACTLSWIFWSSLRSLPWHCMPLWHCLKISLIATILLVLTILSNS